MNKVYPEWLPKESLGDRLKTLRTAKQLTTRQLADLSGISASTISRVERGYDLQVKNLIALCRALDVELASFIQQVTI